MEEQRFIVFRLNTERFGLPIGFVREIMQPQKIVRLPQSSSIIKGVVCLRQAVIPVIDLKRRFYGISIENVATGRIIIMELEGWLVGILVDDVLEVITLPREAINSLPPFMERIVNNSGMWGIGKAKEQLVILLDLTKVFDSTEKSLLQEAVN